MTKKKINPCKTKVVYFDNNGTTKLCKAGKDAMIRWLESRANPSSDSILSKKSAELIEYTREYILKHCKTSDKKYTVIFTSGASESNCFILRSVCDSYYRHTKNTPHIITSSIEHKSIIHCCDLLNANGRAKITYIEPNAYGFINPDLVEKAITKETALISIMHANNEIGSINDIKSIGLLAKKNKIPFHTDMVQTFGKYRISLKEHGVDALSMSFHKLYGPMGLGLLIMSNDLIDGYEIQSQINGSQQNNLRGGTENVPAIAGAVATMEYVFTNRERKNKILQKIRNKLISNLEKEIPMGEYKSYFQQEKPTRNEFIVLGPPANNNKNTQVLPNTVLISFVKNEKDNNSDEPFCNVNLKKYLACKNIIVSIGSACSTSDKNASHVVYAIRAPAVIRQGIIRISMSDETTEKEIDILSKELIKGVKKQMKV